MPSGAKSEFQQLKDRLRATWMAGDFGRVAKYAEALAEEFVARRDLKPKVRVLDVACGSGNLAIPAAQAGAIVTGVGRRTINVEFSSRKFRKNPSVISPYQYRTPPMLSRSGLAGRRRRLEE